MTKQKLLPTILAVILFAVVVGVVYFFQKQPKVQLPQAFEFAGAVEKVEGNNIITKGLFRSDEHPEWAKPENEQPMTIVVGPRTQITKIVQYLPSKAELEKTGGMYEPAKLKSQEVSGSLDEIASGAIDGVFASSEKDIYTAKKFTATTIKYYTREQAK